VSRRLAVALSIGALGVVALVAALVLSLRDSGPQDYASAASSLCDDALEKIDDLGDPSSEGLGVVLERVEIGEQLVDDLDALEPSAGEEQQAEALVFAYRNYYRSLRLGYEALRANQRSALEAISKAAEKSLDEAVAAADAIGASGCAQRPAEST
jgi:hypothetical protein